MFGTVYVVIQHMHVTELTNHYIFSGSETNCSLENRACISRRAILIACLLERFTILWGYR